MLILAIETTGAYASVALAEACDDFRILARVQGHDRYSHLQNLTPQIKQVLEESKSSINDVSAIAVANGPGSFTGIRIGVSTARALSQVTGIPCVPVSSLEALALRAVYAADEAGEAPAAGALICPILDARRSQVYGAAYLIDGQTQLKEVVKAGPYMIDEFMDLVSGYDQIYLMGDGVDTCGEKAKQIRTEGIAFAPEEIRYQRAEEVARLGAAKFASGSAVEFEKLEPEYMRMAEAERKLRAKQAAAAQSESKVDANG